MSDKKLKQRGRKEGSVLAPAIILLGVAGLTIGAVMVNSGSYARQAAKNKNLDKAMMLADAGLRAALVDLNAGGDGNITLAESKSFFSKTTPFDHATWGFRTSVSTNNKVTAVGVYQGHSQDIEASFYLGSGSHSVHWLYNLAMYAGNSSLSTNYVLEVGGTGSGEDFVNGDVYSGKDIRLSGTCYLRHPEIINEVTFDGIYDPLTETWQDAFAPQVFSNPLTKAQFDAYKSSVAVYADDFYGNGKYDIGEPFVDSYGNGVYDEGEVFDDANGNGVRDSGDGYIDKNGNGYYDSGDVIVDNGNGQWDEGEEWTEDRSHGRSRLNGRYDPANGFWKFKRGSWRWRVRNGWKAEKFEDSGDGNFDPGESYVDGNGIYDEGEEYLDDRNGVYDYGTMAYGSISGMPSPGPGQQAATGNDMQISPPVLDRMYYDLSRVSNSKPGNALGRWGHDVAVTAADYGNGSYMAITDETKPEHIFIRNPSTSSSQNSNGAYIRARSYSYTYDDGGNRVDDYFLEDPADSTYNSPSSSGAINGISVTRPMYLDVQENGNDKVYYVDGNVYIHSPVAYALRFREPGTRITIVAKGNITISDEFYYNADYDSGIGASDLDSTIVKKAQDALCLIALKNDNCANSGNVYIGDRQFGTGGSIHALLYAENDFVDNNLNTSGQPFISVYGNMTAGNHIQLNRLSTGSNRTRLDVTLDDRIRNGEVSIPGLPHAVSGELNIRVDSAWHMVPGTWKSWSMIQ